MLRSAAGRVKHSTRKRTGVVASPRCAGNPLLNQLPCNHLVASAAGRAILGPGEPFPTKHDASVMIPAMGIAESGEQRAWERLAASDPAMVCIRSGAAYDSACRIYRLLSFGQVISVHPGERQFAGLDPEGAALLERCGPFFPLTVVWYLLRATSGTPVGRLVNTGRLPGGDLFAKGTHVLPLDALAEKYGERPETFLAAGAALGGRLVGYGDAAIELPALPKVPVTLILWTADDEFPARADLLFDATAPRHLPTDVLWAVAMLALQLMLESAPGKP